MNELEQTQLVYVGNRPFKTDNICNTGTTWFGFGDVKAVARKLEPAFLKHPDVWQTKTAFDQMQGEAVPAKNLTDCKTVTKPVKAPVAPTTPLKNAEDESDPEGSDEENPDGENEDAASGVTDVTQKIKAAILSLEQGNDAHFSSTNGVPIVAAVRNAADDQTIAAKQVAAAWKELKANEGGN